MKYYSFDGLSLFFDVQVLEIVVTGMTLAMELLMSRVELKGSPYTACTKDPESSHCYRQAKQ